MKTHNQPGGSFPFPLDCLDNREHILRQKEAERDDNADAGIPPDSPADKKHETSRKKDPRCVDFIS
jgi:hypothetical protein